MWVSTRTNTLLPSCKNNCIQNQDVIAFCFGRQFKVQPRPCIWPPPHPPRWHHDETSRQEYLQVQFFLNSSLVPLWSLPPPEATVHQAGDGVYHVKEQVGQDSGPGGLTLWHPTVRTLMAATAQHVPVREWAKHQTFARVWQILQPYSWCLDTCVQTDQQWIKGRSKLCTQLQLRARKLRNPTLSRGN